MLVTDLAQWDADDLLLATPGGTVNLRDGTIRPATPDDLITKLTGVAPATTSDCPTWRQFLQEVARGDIHLVKFLQVWIGYCLTGLTNAHALVFLYGTGGNGKSVFVNVVRRVLGGYAVEAALDTFVATRGDRHTTELAMLRGARLVTASEVEKGRVWAEGRIKQVTGGDPITARFMRENNFTFIPKLKLMIVGNDPPHLRIVNKAIARRMNIIPFLHEPATVDLSLEEKLMREAPGILRWMIEGCLAWQAEGLERPAIILEATETYLENQDVLGRWLNEVCDIGASFKALSGELYKSFDSFLRTAGEEVVSHKSFSENLRTRGYEPRKGANGARWTIGLRLRTAATITGGG